MKCGDDLICFLIKTMQHALGENSFTENHAEQIELQLRKEYGGQAVYVSKLDRETRRVTVLREFNGCNRKELCDKHNLSRAQFYRLLKGR
jgi:Mor family transcriptional regulator